MFPTSQWAGMLGTICIDDDLSSGRGVVEEASTLGGIDGGACRAQSVQRVCDCEGGAGGCVVDGPPPLLRVVREVMRHGACWASAPSSSCCESQNKNKRHSGAAGQQQRTKERRERARRREAEHH
jgi:hypothetical protein